MIINKNSRIFFISTALCMAMSFPVMADTKISSVSLKVSSNIEVGESDSDIEITTSSGKYYVDGYEVTNEPDDEWEEGDKPKVTVTLYPEDGYYFSTSFTKSKITLTGDDATVSSISDDEDELVIKLTLDALDDSDSDYELDVTNLEWDDSDGVAYWEEAEDAKKYEVRLYRGSSSVTSAITTTNTYYNFSSYFTKSGDYTFKVRAVYNSSNKGSWEESDELSVSSSEAADIRENGGSSVSNSSSSSSSSSGGPSGTAKGAWLKDDIGWWYCNADRSYPISCWQYIDNYWYYFDGSGYMVTGWVYWNNVWYYCGSSGAMLTNTWTPDGYYVGSDGAWIQ